MDTNLKSACKRVQVHVCGTPGSCPTKPNFTTRPINQSRCPDVSTPRSQGNHCPIYPSSYMQGSLLCFHPLPFLSYTGACMCPLSLTGIQASPLGSAKRLLPALLLLSSPGVTMVTVGLTEASHSPRPSPRLSCGPPLKSPVREKGGLMRSHQGQSLTKHT